MYVGSIRKTIAHTGLTEYQFCFNLYVCVCMHLLFWFTFQVFFFATSRQKGSRPKWTIYKHKSDKIKKKCLIKILNTENNVAEFLIFVDTLFGQFKNITLGLKKYHKNERHLCLVAHIFTKVSHDMCLINTHILLYQHARCNCKLQKALLFYSVFFGIFINI